jgi:hypothetical protein
MSSKVLSYSLRQLQVLCLGMLQKADFLTYENMIFVRNNFKPGTINFYSFRRLKKLSPEGEVNQIHRCRQQETIENSFKILLSAFGYIDRKAIFAPSFRGSGSSAG